MLDALKAPFSKRNVFPIDLAVIAEKRGASSQTIVSITRFLAITLCAAFIISLRRYSQILTPEVWAEDGTYVLPGFIKYGWASFLDPVQGYLILSSKLISFISASISFFYYPEISTGIAIVAQAACVAAIAVAPTYLSWRVACALAVVLVPSGAEVFATPLYVMWWVGILPFLTLLWLPNNTPVTRAVLLVVGGLSSPIVIFAAPLFVLRSLVLRGRAEYVIAAVAVACAAIQSYLVKVTNPVAMSPFDALHQPVVVIGKYFGSATPDWPITQAAIVGVAMIAVLLAGLISVPKGRRFAYFLLGLAICAAIGSSVVRVSPTAPHPLWMGPRYFFYPMILMLWMLLWIMAQANHRILACAAAALTGLYLSNLSIGFYYPDPITTSWRAQLTACADGSGDHKIDVQYWTRQAYWKLPMTSDDCRRLLGRE